MQKTPLLAIVTALLLMAAGCAQPAHQDIDYTAWRESKPASILVLPPQNNSPDIRATYSFLSTVTRPLAEAGYYVFPVALVDQTFKENGLVNPGEMHQAPLNKLREIFGADAVLYITITQYGSSYRILSSEVRVTAEARLIDARNGQELWHGEATAAKGSGNNSSLTAALVNALVNQVVNSIGDPGHEIARQASQRLFQVGGNGLLPGPRSRAFTTVQ